MKEVLLVGLFIISGFSYAITYEDGETHTINDTESDTVYVRDNFWNEPTTLNVISGANIERWVEAYDTSLVQISGNATVGAVYPHNYSQVTITGGTLNHMITRDYSQLDISGNTTTGNILALGNSEITVNCLINGDLFMEDSSRVNIFSGGVQLSMTVEHDSQVTINGGMVSSGMAYDTSSIILNDGTAGELGARNYSEIHISGGVLSSFFWAMGSGKLVVSGTDFMVDGQSIEYGTYDTGGRDQVHGYLTGTLSNGDMINNDFYLYDNATLVLIPEPCTILLLGLGGLALRHKLRR